MKSRSLLTDAVNLILPCFWPLDIGSFSQNCPKKNRIMLSSRSRDGHWMAIVCFTTCFPDNAPGMHEQWCSTVYKNVLIELLWQCFLISLFFLRIEAKQLKFYIKAELHPLLHHCSCIPGSSSGKQLVKQTMVIQVTITTPWTQNNYTCFSLGILRERAHV